MSKKLHIQQKSYYFCNNILRGKCKFILERRIWKIHKGENRQTLSCVISPIWDIGVRLLLILS